MIVIVMGVAGSGKTTIGRNLAQTLNWRYLDADDFHSSPNVEKMKSGIPLDDDDRRPWLLSLQRALLESSEARQSVVLACSALRQAYREMLSINDSVRFVYLKGDYELISDRLRARPDHYMNPALLDSQLEALEHPHDALTIDAALSPKAIIESILTELKL